MTSKPRIIHNSTCLKCGRLERAMVGLGPLVMCNGCFNEEFLTDDPVVEEREKYLHWLDVYKEAEI